MKIQKHYNQRWTHITGHADLGEWSQVAFSQQTGIDGGVADVRRHTRWIRHQILTRFRPPGGAALSTDYRLQQENTQSLTSTQSHSSSNGDAGQWKNSCLLCLGAVVCFFPLCAWWSIWKLLVQPVYLEAQHLVVLLLEALSWAETWP